MTLTLESALADLPAKPRVHELSKRVGTTSKEMIAVLNERGLTVSSASASVPREVAVAVIEQYLGEPAPTEPVEAPAESLAAAEAPVAAEAPAAEPVAAEHTAAEHTAEPEGHRAETIVETPAEERPHAEEPPAAPVSATVRDPLGPLFLPPTEATGPAGPAAEPDETGEDSVAEAPARRSRRRRGRSTGRRVEPEETTEVAEEPEADEPEPAAAEGTESDQDESGDGGRRRRRRGRRGRGRTVEADERAEDDDAKSDESAAGDDETQSDDAEPDEAGAEAPADAETDAESDTDSDEESGTGGGSRRRRRRRRRSSGDEAGPREDDPDNTVVHVRESRGGGSAAAVNNEVQGVRGSTRLEAKRQRRRDSRESSRRRPQILTEAEFLARREAVERVMAVRQRGDLAQVALLEDGILVEHFVSQTGADSLIGSVFLGKVQNVLPSMEAAFVDIGRGRNAVIYAGEVNWDAAGLGGKARRIESALTSGDTILAQVSKDPVGHKGARLTTQISLPGRFLVYVPGGGATGISRKLPDTERKRLKAILDRIVPEDAGVIIRTAAEGVSEEELARDVERLKAQWEEISRRSEAKGSAPTLLYAEPGTLIKVVRDLFNSDISRLVVDGDDAWEPVNDYVNAVAPELADRLVRWPHEGTDVFANYRIDEQIAKALERKVHLPSGGSLVIDRTEAMTVVDVNTGKYTGSGGNLEETVTKNNLEAAEEIVRQLRLRDIGGIIVVDFIDMVLESNRELVLRRLTEALGRDRTRHQVAEVTSLGLVQMTRKRMGTGLVEAFSEPCPHCGGRGIVLHEGPVATVEEAAPTTERRGKGRRRGRDGGRAAPAVEEIVIPRVEMAAGRRPDPRGPKPPTLQPHQLDDEPADGPTTQTHEADDLARVSAAEAQGDLIAAVADAAAAAAMLADEAGEPIDLAEDSADEVDGGWRHDSGADSTAAEPVDGPTAEIPAAEITLAAEPDAVVVAEPDELRGVTEPVEVVVAAEPLTAPELTDRPAAQPVRRRRAAGRAAGAPSTAVAVDIVVAEPTGNGDGAVAEAPVGGYLIRDDDVAARPARRAASRPAGPSAATDDSAADDSAPAGSADGGGAAAVPVTASS